MASDEIHVYKDEVNRIFFGSDLFTNAYLWKDFIYVNEQDNDTDWNYLLQNHLQIECLCSTRSIKQLVPMKACAKTKGEALAQRAYAYFMLVNQYAKHYDLATCEKDLAVPLYLEADINAAKPRATVKQVYDLVENDLKASLDMLPPTPEFQLSSQPGRRERSARQSISLPGEI